MQWSGGEVSGVHGTCQRVEWGPSGAERGRRSLYRYASGRWWLRRVELPARLAASPSGAAVQATEARPEEFGALGVKGGVSSFG